MKIVALALVGLMLTGCAGTYAGTNSVKKQTVDGTECVVVTSQSANVSVDCDWK